MLGKHISVVRALCYIVAQCIGAVIGSAIAKVVTNGRQFQSVYGGSNVITLGISEERAFLGEASRTDNKKLSLLLNKCSDSCMSVCARSAEGYAQ
jgi:glycerol uptake facilitator-like aquaporin